MATVRGYHIEIVSTRDENPQGFSILRNPTDTVENIYIKVTDKLKVVEMNVKVTVFQTTYN